MMKESERYMVGLDIGTTKIACVITYVNDDDSLDVRGYGLAKSEGMVNGRVVDVNRTVQAIKSAVDGAEVMSGVRVEAVYVGMAGDYIKSTNAYGMVVPRTGEVTQEDVSRCITSALKIIPVTNDQLLHTIPQEFKVNGHAGIQNPLGLTCQRLDADVHIVQVGETYYNDLCNCVEHAGLQVNRVFLESIASAEAVLSPQERHLGVCLVDIGGGTSDCAVFVGGSVRHTFEIVGGGKALTDDLANYLNLGLDVAEDLKVNHGCCYSRALGEEVLIEVPSVGGNTTRTVGNEVVCQLLEERLNATLTTIDRNLAQTGFGNLVHNVVLTGGTSMMRGIGELAYEVFSRPVRVGHPNYQGDLSSKVNDPRFSTAVGLVLFGWKGVPVFTPDGVDDAGAGGLWDSIKRLFGRKD
jgi:cell division protein FtsA